MVTKFPFLAKGLTWLKKDLINYLYAYFIWLNKEVQIQFS